MLHGERTVPVTFDFVALTARAEDLQYLSLAQAWEIAHPTPEALEAALRRSSTPDCLLTWNLEEPKNSLSTNFTVQEPQLAWYCLRLSEAGTGRKRAITSAFYFEDGIYRPPPPVRAQVHARIVDAHSGAPLAGSLTEVAYYGTFGQDGKRHQLGTGEGQLTLTGTFRLRAEADGYAPLVLSPFLDNPGLLQLVTGLHDNDLLDWRTFERTRDQLSSVELVFKLQKNTP